LGIIKLGGLVVSLAASFSGDEIAVRLEIAKAKAVFTQDYINWGGKQFALYEKIQATSPIKIILVTEEPLCKLRTGDIQWKDFLVQKTAFTPVSCGPMQACQILFSSGTTGHPKAIVWNHTTPLKVASDAHLHHDIHTGDTIAWPTNLGWMMGPWLVYAALINQATLALYPDVPKSRAFGKFIADTRVTLLGVVPTLVATWRESQCMQGLDWSHIKAFSSTGECSNPEDMFYLMSLAQYKPVIEYCGGTEIGGAYISSTLIESNCPSVFTTPAIGSNFVILNDSGEIATQGEVAIIPPAIGLSVELLNANHDATYFDDMPTLPNGKPLRRHGDQIMLLPGGSFSILGRIDDTMNIGGIKVSAAEIERALAGIDGILELAAIAVPPPNSGPSLLVIYGSCHTVCDKESIQTVMQQKLNEKLNPLFRIHNVILTDDLPKTASNKIMRRELRRRYLSEQK
jgi:acetyl-CoA synthetase